MPRVIAAIDDQVNWLRTQGASDDRIAGWLTDLFDLTDSLYHSPRRHPVAELESAELGIEIHRVVFGDYIIYYHVDELRRVVEVLHFRHAAREAGGLMVDDE
ncbi:MAG: type II toxin-antitoxin system RelE/ParE family toxin [Phycisphaerales bacterium]|nr:type II toxin-antitoxin system RelE/ParE family toxin [Phycisphaerales bacterium]MCB9864500.1 type II toxin-antitoxin system RelE/ParE family toxin [Phycisphaerales bacterium]